MEDPSDIETILQELNEFNTTVWLLKIIIFINSLRNLINKIMEGLTDLFL